MSEKLWGKRKATLMVATILATVLASIGGLYYYIMHNTILISFVIADDRIIASDRVGPYKQGVDGVIYARDDLFYTRDEEGYMGTFSLNGSSRSVKVNFTHTLWKDANLRDVKVAKEKEARRELTPDEQIEIFENEIKKMREGEKTRR